jgi:hypothetical protein
MVEAKAIGRYIDQNAETMGAANAWAVANFAILASAIMAMLLLALMWKLRPRA